MPDFVKLSQGPWEKSFSGNFEQYPLEIYTNNQSLLFVVILEQDANKQVMGSIIEAYQVFSVTGDMQSFVETLPRELIFFGKHDEKETTKFMAVGSSPTYAEWNEESFYVKADELIKKVQSSSRLIEDVSKAYDIKLKKLHESPDSTRQAFFSQPLMVPLLSTQSHGLGRMVYGTAESGGTGSGETVLVSGQVVLGVSKDTQQVVEENITDFFRCIVSDGQQIDRRLIMHVLIEGTLLSNVAAVVWDYQNQFSTLSIPSQDKDALKKTGIMAETIGFPVKSFKAIEDIQVNLSAIPPDGLMELFGAGSQVHVKKLVEVAQKEKIESIPQWMEKVKATPNDDNFTGYSQGKAIRTLQLIQLRYPKLFDGPNNVEEISKNWIRAIGRVGLIDTRGLDTRQQILLFAGMLSEIRENYQKKGTSKSLRSVIFMPEFFKISDHAGSKLAKKITDDLVQLKEYGVGFVVSTGDLVDIDEGLRNQMETTISVVVQNDVGIAIKKRKQYRCLIRPTFSQFIE